MGKGAVAQVLSGERERVGSRGHSYLSFPPENMVGIWFIGKAKCPQTPVGHASYKE